MFHTQNLAIVEYLGTYPETASLHGNAKKTTNSEYIRSSEAVMETIAEEVKHQAPLDVYTNMVLNDSLSAPRDLKQVQNVKKRIKSEISGVTNPPPPPIHRNNNADDIQHVINCMNNNPLIQ